MPIVRDRAICLRTFEYSETSQILTLFGRSSGLVRVIAKGAHRRTKAGASKFDGGVDLLDLGDAVWIQHTSRELSTLTEWKQLSGNLSLRRSLRAVLLAQVIAEVIPLLLAEHDPHLTMFLRLRATLPLLSSEQGEEQFLALLLDVIQQAGFLPELNELPGINPGQARMGNVVLSRPRTRGLAQRLPRLTAQQTNPLIHSLLRHVEAITQRPIRSRGMLFA